MAFTPVSSGGRPQARLSAGGNPEIGFYGKTAQFRISPSAIDALTEQYRETTGNADAEIRRLAVLFDQDTNRIAFRGAADDDVTAVTLRKDSEKSLSRQFGFRQLALLAGLETNARWTLPMVLDTETGLYVINLSDRTALPIAEGSRPRKATATTEAAEGSEASVAVPAEAPAGAETEATSRNRRTAA